MVAVAEPRNEVGNHHGDRQGGSHEQHVVEISVLIGTRLIVTNPNAMSSKSLSSGRSITAARPTAAASTTYPPGRQWKPNSSRPDAGQEECGHELPAGGGRLHCRGRWLGTTSGPGS